MKHTLSVTLTSSHFLFSPSPLHSGCILVLAPDPGLFHEILESADRVPIGQRDAMAGPDEYFITQFYLDKRIPWHHLHYR